jgi:hypothetical protein
MTNTADMWKVSYDDGTELGLRWTSGLAASIYPAPDSAEATKALVVMDDSALATASDRMLRLTQVVPVLDKLLTGGARVAKWSVQDEFLVADRLLAWRGTAVDVRIWFRPECKGTESSDGS